MNRGLYPIGGIGWFVLFLFTLNVIACSSTPYVWASDIPAERARPAVESEKIGRGDILSISVVGQENLTGPQTVGADGTVSIPNIGSVPLSGLTVDKAASVLERRLSNILQEPRVSVLVVTRFIEVSLLGEVQSPGKYSLQSGDGVASALALAGGITEYGSEDAIFLIRDSEPQRIRFRLRDLLRGGRSASAFALRDGDIVVVE